MKNFFWIPVILLGINTIIMSPQFIGAPTMEFQTALTVDNHSLAITPVSTPVITTVATLAPLPTFRPISGDSLSFDEAVKQWIAVLAKDKGFENWQEATWDSIPLGPGTHSWVVILRKSHLEVGYLIVSATEEGKHYSLTEYGTGSKPLFSLQTLYRSLIQFELIHTHLSFEQFLWEPNILINPVYLNTLEAFWEMTIDDETFYLDAKSGERLPSLSKLMDPSASKNMFHTNEMSPTNEVSLLLADTMENDVDINILTIVNSLISLPFDPMEIPVWIQGEPLPLSDFESLQTILENHAHPTRLTYCTKLFDQQVIYPFAVFGYQLWSDGEAYVALDHEGPRYINFTAMQQIGSFYKF